MDFELRFPPAVGNDHLMSMGDDEEVGQYILLIEHPDLSGALL